MLMTRRRMVPADHRLFPTSSCTDDVASWIRANRLQLNTSKTDLLWCSTARRQHQLPSTALRVGSDLVQPPSSMRDLGIFIDAELSMRTQVQRTVARCFAALRKLRSIRHSVPASVYQTLVTALVLSRVDYGNATPCVVNSNLCSTPLPDPSPVFDAQTTSLRRSPAFTGCAHLSAYNSSWQC